MEHSFSGTVFEGGVCIKKRFFILLLTVLILVSFSGCTIVSGIETYLKPPKLSEQHEQIYNALINAEGTKISLKYPKSGNYLSAFVVADIDNEPSDEAIVFYEKTNLTGSDLSTLRINFLDQKNGKWDSVYDFATDGTEVERVFISKLGSSDIKNIIIGIGSRTEKNAQLFCYDGEKKPEPKSLGIYSVMDVTDLNNDASNELIMINNSLAENTAQIKWLDSDGTLVSGPVLNLNENSTEVAQLIYGKINTSATAVYLDSYINTNTIMTEILYPETFNNTIYLNSLRISNAESSQINRTIRNSSLISRDIDNDGIIEIPINTVFKGYEDKPETEQIQMTNWYVYEDNMFIRKYSSFYSITDGYAFILPEKWLESVTIKTINDDVIFCIYDEKTENQTELMRICVAGSAEAEEIINSDQYSRYERIYSNGDTVYLACLPSDSPDPLTLSISEILFNFKVIK